MATGDELSPEVGEHPGGGKEGTPIATGDETDPEVGMSLCALVLRRWTGERREPTRKTKGKPRNPPGISLIRREVHLK